MFSSAQDYFAAVDSNHKEKGRQLWREIPLSPELWTEVYTQYPERRSALSLHRRIPDHIIHLLAVDDDENIRVTIAMKRRLPPDLFELLSKDSSESVRQRIAFNATTPLQILRRLTGDSSPYVSRIAIEQMRKHAV